MRTLLLLIGLTTALGACKPPPLEYTKGKVLFAESRDAFYHRKWKKSFPVNQRQICAGFVHKQNFGHYLKYGAFRLMMALQVYKDGEPILVDGDVVGWKGGTLLRTLKKPIRVGERHNRYVWCGRLRKGGAWKPGAMRFVFVLQGTERAMSEPLAKGVLRITP